MGISSHHIMNSSKPQVFSTDLSFINKTISCLLVITVYELS
jgi:hypothetical protein